MAQGDIHHPFFARSVVWLSWLTERGLGEYRDQLLAGLRGRVLELGAGDGANFPHYPGGVEEVLAIEPEPYLRAAAERAAARTNVRVEVTGGVASRLPVDSQSFDAAVTSLVLCSVPDQRTALGELRRVIKPGGELRFLEHIRSDRSGKAIVQGLFDRSGVWPLLGGGCHCGRATMRAIQAAGFRIETAESVALGPPWLLSNPHVLGVARLD